MDTYLNNKYCKFKPSFPVRSIKKNLVVSSLFRMTNVYKKMTSYTNGLKYMYDMVNKYLPGFTIRVFIDKNISDDPEFDWMKEMFELVVFECDNFLDNSKKYHRGLFGTLVRFFPMFDFPNNDANHVIVLDADIMKKEMISIISEYKLLSRRSDLYFHYHGSFHAGFFSFGIPHKFPHVFAGRMISFKRYDHKILTDFLDLTLENKIPIKGYRTGIVAGKQFYQYLAMDNEQQFIYSIDEYFVNNCLLKYLIDNSLLFSSYFFYNISSYPYYYQHVPENKEFLIHIMGKYYDHKKSFTDNLNNYDKVLYKQYKGNDQVKYFTQRLYYLFDLMLRDDKYVMVSKEQLELLKEKKYFGIANCEQLIFSNDAKPIYIGGCLKYDLLSV